MSGTTVCPDWCEAVGSLEDNSGHQGPTWPAIDTDDEHGEVWQGAQISAGSETTGALRVYIDSRDPRLTPEQAREVARHLIEAGPGQRTTAG